MNKSLTETEIAAMKERDNDDSSMTLPVFLVAKQDRHKLLLEREELLKDKERLDWLENGASPVEPVDWSTGRITRAAIDAAIDAAIEGEEGMSDQINKDGSINHRPDLNPLPRTADEWNDETVLLRRQLTASQARVKELEQQHESLVGRGNKAIDGYIERNEIIDARNTKLKELRERVKELEQDNITLEVSHRHDHDGITAYSNALFGRSDIGYTEGVRRIEELRAEIEKVKGAA